MVLDGLDALIFTAGIGEHAHEMQSLICEKARWLSVELDAAANKANRTVISSATSRVLVCVIPTNEEIVIARHTFSLLSV